MDKKAIRVRSDQWDRWKTVADHAGVTLNEWIRNTLDAAARKRAGEN